PPIGPASRLWNAKSTTSRDGKPLSTSPRSWPRPAPVPRCPGTPNGSRRRLRSRSPRSKKKRPLVVRLLGGLAITVMTLYCSPRGRTGQGRGREGTGLYPELAAYRISEGCSPNVQAEVGRQVGLMPIEQARAELARRGLVL